MSLKVIRNDITKMDTDAIVNTASPRATVGRGLDKAIYKAAGYYTLLNYRRENIGEVEKGEVFITPGFGLKAKYIIHAVSPLFIDGQSGEEEELRSCYRKCLDMADSYGIKSIAFPLILTGSHGFLKEEGMMIAADEITKFLNTHKMDVYLVLYSKHILRIGRHKFRDIDEYISEKYVDDEEDRSTPYDKYTQAQIENVPVRNIFRDEDIIFGSSKETASRPQETVNRPQATTSQPQLTASQPQLTASQPRMAARKPKPKASRSEARLDDLDERIKHDGDTFSEYLMYKIQEKGLKNSEVYKKALVDKKIFSKIKNNSAYHPNKLTAMCLCVGAQLNIDEAKDLLLRAGYGFSPCDKTDIIFEYFIENGFYDMIDLDIQLEEHGLPCIIG